MKPTDEERREVAAKLREHIGKPLFTGQDVEGTMGVQRSDFDVILADASYRRLADLIEPEERTCRNTSEAVVHGPFTCSACGEHSETWIDIGFGDRMMKVPKFCPNCGAKVVRDA